jgi:hypothetical protein
MRESDLFAGYELGGSFTLVEGFQVMERGEFSLDPILRIASS